jgi:hypothetical protein
MNRSAFILGISLLVVAVTMAVTITVRNAPDETAEAKPTARTAKHQGISRSEHRGLAASRGVHRSIEPRSTRRPLPREQYEVGLPEDRLMAFPAKRQEELRKRVALVQKKARMQLERMTKAFDLTTAQRRKMFPLLVQSTPGYDPVMQVAGVAAPVDSGASADEEIHALLDPEQQMELEEEEINRQLWWQDLIGRLEKELVDSTGGAEVPTAAPEAPAAEPSDPAPAPAAPPARPTRNMLDFSQ